MFQTNANRREFLSDVGRGMLAASVGLASATNMGFLPASAADDPVTPDRLTFGPREKLVDLVQETPPDRLLPEVMQLVRNGTDLREIVGAAALANARRFGGEDYIGFHTFMALAPAYAMSQELPADRRPLPVLKVLYRNASRIKDAGGPSKETLRPVAGPASSQPGQSKKSADAIRDAVHRQDIKLAEQSLIEISKPDEAWNSLLETVQEGPEVHRIVLAHRAWDMLQIVGEEHARTMLRQSVRYCIKAETPRSKYYASIPELLAKAFDQHKLTGRPRGTRTADAAWIDRLSDTIFRATPEQAVDAIAAALAEGFAPEPISDAIALTANQLLLRDPGRLAGQVQPNKPAGSVHGDSIGVHACDAVNAWRHIARASNPRNSAASLILSAYHVARDRTAGSRTFLEWQPRPHADVLAKIGTTAPDKLLIELDGAIRENNQERAAAVAHRYAELGHSHRPLFDVLLKFAISEDGALHAEKFYRTATDEFSRLPAEFRNRQLTALARVTASAHGYPAPGVAEARKLLS